MKFGLLVIGDEILSGKRTDKHLPKVIELRAASAPPGEVAAPVAEPLRLPPAHPPGPLVT